MGRKHEVFVHTMTEAETETAEAILGAECVRDGETLVHGWADARQIRKLQRENLIVESVETAAAASPPLERLFRASAKLDWAALDAAGAPVAEDGHIPAIPSTNEPGMFTLKLNRPHANFSEVLGPLGVDLDRSINGFGVAHLDRRQRGYLEADERIEILPFNHSPIRAPSHALSETEREAVAPATGKPREFDLIAHSPARRPEIEAWVESKSGALTLVGVAADRVRIRVEDTSPLLDEADELDAVLDVCHIPGVFLCLDHVRPLVGLAASADDGSALLGPGGILDGSGETIGIIDGAVDENHPDLIGRVRTIFGSPTPPSAHGTHVAGILAGDGSRSMGRFRGIAPAATLSIQALAVQADGRIDLEVDFGAMLERSYQDGARILNLSLDENGPPAFYSHRAGEIDAFAVKRPDMLIVIAAGNRAMTEQLLDREKGQVGLESVSAPGVAKNALTVGASCSDRTGGGHAATDWASYDPGRFVSPPTSLESISGDASRLAAFSGRGWSQESRIKPELVAPGTNVVAARAQGSPATALWGAHSSDYLYSGGTSMAAPVVAGCAALVRQYYRQRGHAAPSSALIRATLANGAVWLDGAAATTPRVPDNACANLDQGFGRVNVRNALGMERPGDRLCYVDVWADGTVSHTLSHGTVSPFSNEADERRYFFFCESEGEVDLAFCYLDPEPGSGGVAFRFQVQPQGGKRRFGNDCAIKRGYPTFGDALDRINKLQVVRLGRVSGKVDLQIRPLALMNHKAGFALVVRGPVAQGLLYAY